MSMVAVGHRVATVLPGCRVPGRFAIDGRCDGDRICVWVRGVDRSSSLMSERAIHRSSGSGRRA